MNVQQQRIDILYRVLYSIYIVLIFEPASMFYLEQTSTLFGYIDSLWKLLSACLSFFVIVALWWRHRPNKWVYPIVLLCVVNSISVLINNGLTEFASRSLALINYVAFAWFLQNRLRYDKYNLLISILYVFSFYTVCTAVTICATQHEGLIPGLRTPVYFFGQKNMIFIYGVPLIAAMVLYNSRKVNSISYLTIFVSMAYCLASTYIDSASSTVCFAAIAIALLYLRIIRNPSHLFHPVVFVVLALVLFFITTIQQQNEGLIGDVLSILGRSGTFSGRTPAWEQALQYFAQSPLIGKGENLVYTLAYGIEVSSAHSFYLASLASYGAIYVAIFVFDILLVSRKVIRNQSIPVCAVSVIYFVLLIHSLYDIMYLSNYIIIRFIVLYELDNHKAELRN